MLATLLTFARAFWNIYIAPPRPVFCYCTFKSFVYKWTLMIGQIAEYWILAILNGLMCVSL